MAYFRKDIENFILNLQDENKSIEFFADAKSIRNKILNLYEPSAMKINDKILEIYKDLTELD